ncbi:uncharacterized protein LOC108030987 [Drosophila biarmipes]|uniref:uncharacterized protein LOC108030987 n=1 Tax=Drosophila biarmipes TaxID=125945 RepID=UPI0007E68DF0|nr:uncharacterized protein LOC108030987 [Drosophila biarmipes]
MSSTALAFLILCLSPALGVLVPQHYCDNHFRYARDYDGSPFIGIFTAPKTKSASLNLMYNWQATFEIQGIHKLFVSPLVTYPSKEEAAANIMNGEPAQVWVRFINVTTELPKLTSLILNGVQLCHSAPYGLPKTRATVKHHMFIAQKQRGIVPTTEGSPPFYGERTK